MNSRQLQKMGVPAACCATAVEGVHTAAKAGVLRSMNLRNKIAEILADPRGHLADPHFATFAQDLLDYDLPTEPTEPISYQTWGAANIDEESHVQMRTACALPMATGAALMPDAHVGYGLPIGGVLALDNAVVPYAVGVDIACRMKLSILDLAPDLLDKNNRQELFDRALEEGTRFGVGAAHARRQDHPVMDEDWSITRVTRESKDKAWKQLGTSGSGNHFVEFGKLTLPADDAQLGLQAGEYLALLSHSGSRGTGSAVCTVYSNIARQYLPRRYEEFGRLAWLSLDTEAGQEYWAAMNLMGDYAAANHDVIHRLVSRLLGGRIIAGVENHHNFAWREQHGGREVIVHRKGATPAGKGVLGVIPGSMADPAYIVRGLGNPASLESASHGAGRAMSRTKAREKYTWHSTQKDLAKRGVRVLSAGADEVPGVYKPIDAVMAEQRDLVETVARFDPRVVKMCGDGSRAED